MRKERADNELTRAELEVMRILWKRGGAFVGQVLEEMPEPKPAYNTVSTIARILCKKGVVGYEAVGKGHRYIPLVDRAEYARTCMRNMAGHFFDHSYAQMLSFLAREEELSVSEVEQIAAAARAALDALKTRKEA